MKSGSTGEAEVIRLRQSISNLLQRKVLEAVEFVLEEELTEASGIGRYERSDTQEPESTQTSSSVASSNWSRLISETRSTATGP